MEPVSKETAAVVNTDQNCKNCHTQLQESDDYCNNCGGKVIRNRLTFRNLFHHINETFFNVDNKLLRTFITLFKNPEEVIEGYIGGLRKKYVDVISYFALALTLSGLQIFVMNKVGIDMTLYDTSTEVGKMQQKLFDSIMKYSKEYQSIIMMSYVPIYALLAKIVFWRNKKFNYTELLVIFLYGQAQLSIISAPIMITGMLVESVPFSVLGTLTLPLYFVYFFYVLKRVYNLSFGKMMVKTLVFFLILVFLMILFGIISGFVMYKMGMFDELSKG